MNIVLTGLRGSGKTNLGKLIAKELEWDFVDLDNQIEKKELKTIPQIVKEKGWKYFRIVEKEVVKDAAKLDKTVIATGGGAIIDKDNEKELKKNGKVIYLHIKPEVSAKRIINSKGRPPLTNKKSVIEEINHLYNERHQRYSESANFIFNRTNNKKKRR